MELTVVVFLNTDTWNWETENFLYAPKPILIKIISRENNGGALIVVTKTKYRKGLIETTMAVFPPSARILTC